jgi:nitrogen regulatory protein PII
MKTIEAIIKPHKLEDIRDALSGLAGPPERSSPVTARCSSLAAERECRG